MRKVLLIDRSGRGHAFADLFSRTNKEVTVYYAPGCSAITTERVISLPELFLSDPLPIVDFAKRENVDFVFVANTGALANGLVDVFRDNNLLVIGPDKQASLLETSKIYGKQFCAKYGIPVADFSFFDNPDDAKSYIRSLSYQVVVKADGLCAGCGAFVCDTVDDAIQAIDQIMVNRDFGEAGNRVVIERRLFGREISFFALVDGSSFKMLPMALDYKRADDENRGILCSGTGAISPHPLDNEELIRDVEAQIFSPFMRGIKIERLNYTGVIYIGAILVKEKLYVLEINVRMGDPEAEVVLPRIESDFFAICKSVLGETLENQSLVYNNLYYCDVVAAQGKSRKESSSESNDWYVGWPYGPYGKYYKITGLDKVNTTKCKVFIGDACVLPEQGLVTDGARVIHVVGFGNTHQEAVENAYANVKYIEFEGIRYRTDIGKILPWD